jgi:hypothetical protein
MEKIKFNDIDLYEIGNSIQISGVIYSGNGKDYLLFLPEYMKDKKDYLEVSDIDWEKFFRQTDLVETKIMQGNKLTIIRKAERQIDQRTMWQVFKRDDYTCRYCGQTGIPLTVDHIVLWEKGGPTTEENLITSCKKCNKTRGNREYAEWLISDDYKKLSENLLTAILFENESVLSKISSIPIKKHQRSR